jgi:hypothetical protein
MSDLYKMGRLVSSDKFVIRVEAAMLKHAQTVPLGGSATTEKNFAIWVLKNPMVPESSMNALVASDPSVLSAATISEDGVIVNSDSVPDSAIQSAVAAKWSLVSTKFPLAAAAPAA